MMNSLQLMRSLRPAYMGLRGMAIGSGSGVGAGMSPEAQKVSEDNLAKSKETQKQRLREMGNDHPGRIFPEPDPTSTAVPGLASEFQAEHDSYKTDSTKSSAPKSPVGNYTANPKPFPESAADKVTEFVKDSYDTLVHGVNNAGQPEVKDKLKNS